MKRTALIVVGVALLVAVAVWMLRRGPVVETPAEDSELATEGQFLSDSLGVGVLLPPSPGWSFHRPDAAAGAPYMSVLNETQEASVRIFKHNKPQAGSLTDVVQRRRDQLAGSFRADDLDDVIEQVMLERTEEFSGFPVWRWQAMTEPVAMAGEEPAKILFLIQVIERQAHVFEAVALVKVPLKGPADQQARTDQLQQDVTFILQSLQVR